MVHNRPPRQRKRISRGDKMVRRCLIIKLQGPQKAESIRQIMGASNVTWEVAAMSIAQLKRELGLTADPPIPWQGRLSPAEKRLP